MGPVIGVQVVAIHFIKFGVCRSLDVVWQIGTGLRQYRWTLRSRQEEWVVVGGRGRSCDVVTSMAGPVALLATAVISPLFPVTMTCVVLCATVVIVVLRGVLLLLLLLILVV